MSNRKHFLLPLVASLSLIGLSVSCNMGLGSQVDTANPDVSITSPDSDGGAFNKVLTLTGTYGDDVGIKSVTVEYYLGESSSSKTTINASTVANADNSLKGTWSADINTSDLKDGTYTVNVIAEDTVGHKTTVKRVIDFDNTAPVFIISSPNSLDSSSPAKYGSSLQLKGIISDKHKVTSINVVLKSNGTEIFNKDFTDFDTSDTSVTIANLKSSDPTLKSNYVQIYGDDTSVGNKDYEFYVTVKDVAGNTSSKAYLKESVDACLKSCGLSTAEVSVADLRDILNGTYSSSFISGENQTKIKAFLDGTPSRSSGITNNTTPLFVRLNAKVNPTYALSTIKYDSDKKQYPTVYIGNAISVDLKVGGDNYNIAPSSLKATIVGQDGTKYPVASKDFTDSEKTPVANITTSTGNTTYFIYPQESYTTANGDVKYLTLGDLYTIEFEDSDSNVNIDTNGVHLVQSDDGETYGFRPAVNCNPANAKMYSKSNLASGDTTVLVDDYTSINQSVLNDVVFMGTGTSENKIQNASWTLVLKESGASDKTINGTIDVVPESESSYSSFTWYTQNVFNNFTQTEKEAIIAGKYYEAEFTASFTNKGGSPYTVTRTFYIDTIAPVFTTNSFASPWVSSTSLYNKLTVSIDAKEDSQSKLAEVAYSFDNTNWNTLPKLTSTTYSQDIDFTNVDNQNNKTVYIKATDNAGNVTSTTTVVNIDKTVPEVTLAPVTELTTIDNELYSQNAFTLNVAATDTNIETKVFTVNGTDKTSAITNGQYLQTNTDGTYVYKYTATDAAGNKTEKALTVIIDNTAPELTITSHAQDQSVSDTNVKFEGKIIEDGIGVGEEGIEYTLTAGDSTESGTATVAGKTWSVDATNKISNEGVVTLTLTAKDKLNNTAAAKTLTIYYDLNKPSLTEESIGIDGKTTHGTAEFNVIASDTNALKSITITSDKTEAVVFTEVENKKTYTATKKIENLADGTYQFTITATDVANKTTTVVRTVKVDKTAPVITSGPSFAEGWITADSLYKRLSLEANDGDTGTGIKSVEYSFDKTDDNSWAELSKQKGNEYASTIDFSEIDDAINKTVYIRVTDNADNTTEATTTINIDKTVPEVTLAPVTELTTIDNELYTKQSFVLNVAAIDINLDTELKTPKFTVNGEDKTSAIKNGTYTQAKVDGTYVYKYTATDKAGNKAEKTLTVTIDNTAPELTVTSHVEDEAVDLPSVEFGGKVEDQGVGVQKVTYTLTAGNITSTEKEANVSGRNWSVDVSKNITKEGTVKITLTAEDKLGNITGSVSRTIYYDKAKPSLDETSVGIDGKTTHGTADFVIKASDTNALNSVVITSDTKDKYAKSIKQVIDFTNTTEVTSSTDENGLIVYTWTKQITDLADGTYQFTITATDAAKKTTTVTRTVKVDNTAPTVSDISLKKTDDTTAIWINKEDNYVTLSLKAKDNDKGTGIKSVQYSFDNSNWQSMAMTGDNTYSSTINCSAWTDTTAKTLYVKATDNADNISDVKNVSVNVDKTLPSTSFNTVTLEGSSSNVSDFDGNTYYTNNGFTLSGTISEANIKSAKLTKDTNAVWSYSSDKAWTYTEGTTDGTYNYTLNIEDIAGNKYTKSVTVIVDKTGPVLSNVNVEPDYKVGSATTATIITENNKNITAKKSDDGTTTYYYTLKGNVSDDGGVGVNTVEYATSDNTTYSSANVVLKTDGSWTADIPVTEVTSKITVKATDTLGNVSALTEKTTTFDFTPPAVTVNALSSYAKSGAPLTGTVTNATTVTIAGTKKGASSTPVATINNGTWTSCIDTSDGEWTYVATATDENGRTATCAAVTTIIDSAAPSLLKDDDCPAADNTEWTKASAPTIVIWAYDGLSQIVSCTYEITNDGNISTGTLARAENTKDKDSITYTKYHAKVSLASGKNTVVISVKDNAGNLSTHPYTYNVDITAPEVTINNKTVTTYATESSSIGNTVTELNAASVTCGIYVQPASITEEQSGIKTIYIYNNKNEVISDSTDVTNEAAHIPSDKLVEGESIYFMQVEDTVGNKSDRYEFTLTVDTQAPVTTVTCADVVNTNEIDGTVTLSGTITDAHFDTSVTGHKSSGKLYYKKASDISYTSVDITANNNTWSHNLDTTDLNDNTDYNFYAEFTDDYDNTTAAPATPVTFKVNQDNDRPRITISTPTGKIYFDSHTISGTVEDYDGTVKSMYVIAKRVYDAYTEEAKKEPSASNTDWKKATVTGTAWFINEIADDSYDWYFYVTDAMGTTFCSANNGSKTGPKINNSNDTHYTFMVDVDKPVITKIEYIVSSSDTEPDDNATWTELTQNAKPFVGGTNHYLFYRVTATDNNGVKSVSATGLGLTTTTVTATGNPATVKAVFGPINTTSDTFKDHNGENTYSFTAVDTTDKNSVAERTVKVDSIAPTVQLLNPTTEEYISSNVKASGLVNDDGDGVGTVAYWTVQRKGNVLVTPYEGDGLASSESLVSDTTPSAWHKLTSGATSSYSWSSSTWTLSFSWSASESSNPYNLRNYYDTNTFASTSGANGLITVPVTFYVCDKLGNAQYQTVNITIDIYADYPKSKVIYPSDGNKLGGRIQAYGSATDNVSVKAVYIQLDTNGDGSFNDTDKAQIQSWKNSGYSSYAGLSDITVNDVATWGIKVSGTSSWSIALNEQNELAKLIADGETSKQFALRSVAVDNNNLAGKDWSDNVIFTIDQNIPTIGKISLTQGNSVQNYSDDMWIKGTWNLTVDLTDENDISYIQLSPKTGSSSTLNETLDLTDTTKLTRITNGYRLSYPISNTYADANGNINAILTVKDDTEQKNTATATISINVDDDAPSIYTISNTSTENETSSLRIMKNGSDEDMLSETCVIKQSNNSFTLGDKVTENKSGFERVVFYFKNATNIFDPMIDVTTDTPTASTVNLTGDYSINTDNLPVYETTVTRSDESTLGLTVTKNIRVGGLVKIGGVYHKIQSVTSGSVVLTDTVPTSYTDAEFVIAQVVDHVAIESGTTGTVFAGDDGDKMVETIERSGGDYYWTAAINSRNIPDGPVEVHIVAFDKAGNMTHGYVSTKVQNNRPRIAKVFIGTDLDGNGKYDFAEGTNGVLGEFNYYATNYDKNDTASETKGYISTLSSSDFIVKDNLVIVPQFVGSINETDETKLKYIVSLVDNTDDNAQELTEAEKDVENATDVTTKLKSMETNSTLINGAATEVNDEIYNMVVPSVGYVYLNNASINTLCNGLSTENQKVLLKLSFWDGTPGLIQGIDSLNAVLNVPLIISTGDGTNPSINYNTTGYLEAVDNSGHVELKEDLPTEFKDTNPTDSVMDRDDKISGIVKFSGTVSDNKRLSTIKLTIDDDTYKSGGTATEYTLATYTSGKWSIGTTLPSGCTFEVNNSLISQTGHTADWTLTFDSSKVSGSAGANKTITIYATDATSNSANSSKQVDVVPYIKSIDTRVSTSSTTTINRSTYGKYSFAAGDTITVTGYNLPTTATDTTTASATSYVEVGSSKVNSTVVEQKSGKSFTIVVPDHSGELVVTTNGIKSINHLNDNSKNKESDEQTDDRYLSVWDVGHSFSGSNGKYKPTLLVDSNGNLFSSWTIMGSSEVQMQKNTSGDIKAVWASFDQPDQETFISVDRKSTTKDEMALVFSSPHVGTAGFGTTNGYADQNKIGGMIGTAIPNDFDSITNAFTVNAGRPFPNITISGNPRNLMDKVYAPGFQLASYAMRRDVSQWTQQHSARYGDNMHFVYYDKINKALRYTYQSKLSSNPTDNAYNSIITGWHLIDGEITDGADRIHGDTNDSIGLEIDSYDTTNGTVTLTTAVTIATGDTLWLSYEDATGDHKYAMFTGLTVNNSTAVQLPSGSLSNLNINTAQNAKGINGAAIYKGASNVVTNGVTNTAAGSYNSIDVTSTGKPVIVYYANNGLRIAYSSSTAPSMSDVSGVYTWSRQAISGVTGGTYVQAKIDPNNYLHIIYRDANGNLCYIKSTNAPDGNAAYTFGTPETIALSSSGGTTYGTLSLITRGSTYTPCVSFLNSEGTENCAKYGLRLSSGKWDVEIIPASKDHYYAGGLQSGSVYVEGTPGTWLTTGDAKNTMDAVVGYDTGRMEVLYHMKEN